MTALKSNEPSATNEQSEIAMCDQSAAAQVDVDASDFTSLPQDDSDF